MKGSNRKVGSHGAVSAPSTSVAAEATRRGYVCKVIKVQFRNRLERFAGGGFTEAFGQGVGPRSILGLQLDQFGHGIRPASCPAAAAVRARVPPTAITTRWRPLEPRTAVARATDLGAKLLAVGPDGALPKVVKASLKLLVRPRLLDLLLLLLHGHLTSERFSVLLALIQLPRMGLLKGDVDLVAYHCQVSLRLLSYRFGPHDVFPPC